jgi:integrase
LARIKVRYLVQKRQGDHTLYYWQPNRALRARGWLPRRLARDTNDFLTALKEAADLNAELDACRLGREARKPLQPFTLPWLIREYTHSPFFSQLAASTRRGYAQCLGIIASWSRDAGDPPLDSLSRRAVKEFYFRLNSRPHQANAVLRVLRLLLNFASDRGLINENPAKQQRLVGTPSRATVWSEDEVKIFIKTAIEAGRQSLAVAVLLGVHLGQRESDILHLAWSQYDGSAIELRQRKTGRLVRVPVATELRRVLEVTPRLSTQIVVSETTRTPYKPDNFRHVFREIADRAGLKNLRFLDLRRTTAVRLAEASCTAIEIAAITGHEIGTTQRILEVYVPRNTQMAQNAMAKLEGNKKGQKLEE